MYLRKQSQIGGDIFYPADRYYLDTLQDFILNEKPIIDKYLSSHVESGIPLADKELDDK